MSTFLFLSFNLSPKFLPPPNLLVLLTLYYHSWQHLFSVLSPNHLLWFVHKILEAKNQCTIENFGGNSCSLGSSIIGAYFWYIFQMITIFFCTLPFASMTSLLVFQILSHNSTAGFYIPNGKFSFQILKWCSLVFWKAVLLKNQIPSSFVTLRVFPSPFYVFSIFSLSPVFWNLTLIL